MASGWIWRRGRRLLSRALALLFLSAFSVVTLAMPLGATKLYLFGISVDQQFRTEYLTRLTDTAAPARHDLLRAAAVLPAGLVLDRRPTRLADRHARVGDVQAVGDRLDHDRRRAGIRVVGQHDSIRVRADRIDRHRCRALAYSPTEPYAAIIAVLLPPVFVLAWSGLRGATRGGGRAAIVGVGVFLGVAALFYTLLLAYAAFTVTIMALVLAVARRGGATHCCGWWSSR